MKGNRFSRLCDERDETVNHTIIEYSKLAQKKLQKIGRKGDPQGTV